jgi:hypothetical protein
MRAFLAPLALVLLTASLAGCIQGAFFPAEIPAASLAPGWSRDDANSQGGERGFEPLVKARYQANVYTDNTAFLGAAFLVSVSDVPLFDEQSEIKKQIDPRIADYGIQLAERSRGTGTIGGAATSFIVYDATRTEGGAQVKGLAIDAPYTCPANSMAVRLFGFAATEVQQPLLGARTDRTTWTELAGGADQGTLGGMVAQVKCSA